MAFPLLRRKDQRPKGGCLIRYFIIVIIISLFISVLWYRLTAEDEDDAFLTSFIAGKSDDMSTTMQGSTRLNHPSPPLPPPQSLEFVHITKTGGTAIEEAAAAAGITWGLCHWEPRALFGTGCQHPDWTTTTTTTKMTKTTEFMGEWWHTPPIWLHPNPYVNSKTFTIVRNPYDRLVSEYYCKYFGFHQSRYWGAKDKDRVQRVPASLDLSQSLKPRESVFEKNGGLNRTPVGDRTQFLKRHRLNRIPLREQKHFRTRLTGKERRNLSSEMKNDTPATLNNWIRRLLKRGLNMKTGHTMPQHFYVFNENGEQVIDHVLRFEALQTEFSELMEQYGLSVELPNDKTNQGHTTEDRMTANDLDSQTIELINEFYSADFELLGYSKREA